MDFQDKMMIVAALVGALVLILKPENKVMEQQTAPVAKVFNGTYTITSPTGAHRTFRIRTALHGDMKGKRLVELLVGPDNENNFQPFGFVDDNGVAVWKKYRGQDGKPSIH